MQTLKNDRKKRLLALSNHDLFKQFNGNPYSISTLASFYKNPFVEDNDLVGIYKRLVAEELFSSQTSSQLN